MCKMQPQFVLYTCISACELMLTFWTDVGTFSLNGPLHICCQHALLRPVVSAVPLCPQTNFTVADTTERLVRPVVSSVPLCPQRIPIVLCVRMRT